MKQGIIRHTLLALALSAFGASTMAQNVEIEPNNSINGATLLIPNSNGFVSVTGYIGTPGTNTKLKDIDLFKFEGRAGETITIDISKANKGGSPSPTNLNSYLTLFGPDLAKMRENDDASCDTDSVCVANSNPPITRDARIDNVVLDRDGWYYVAVTPLGIQFKGVPTEFVSNDARSNGPYTLTVTGLIPPVILMNIDIKPGGSHEVNPKSKGTVPVVLRAGKDFDPFKIDVSSLRFGVKGDEQSLRRCNDQPLGNSPDRLCHFDNEIAMQNWTPGIVEATIKGKTTDQKQFEGSAPIKVHASPNDQ